MNKKNIFLLIFALLFFIIALAFLLSTFSDINTDNNNIISNNLSNLPQETSPELSNDTSSLEDTTNISDTSDSTSENLPNLEYDSLIDFTYYNKENEEISLSRYKDKPLAILFSDFAEEFDVSVDYLSLMDSYYDDYKSNVQFLCIDKSKFANTDSNIEILKDKDGIEKYSIETLPTLVFINKEGEIMNQTTSLTLDSLKANLDLITGNF